MDFYEDDEMEETKAHLTPLDVPNMDFIGPTDCWSHPESGYSRVKIGVDNAGEDIFLFRTPVDIRSALARNTETSYSGVAAAVTWFHASYFLPTLWLSSTPIDPNSLSLNVDKEQFKRLMQPYKDLRLYYDDAVHKTVYGRSEATVELAYEEQARIESEKRTEFPFILAFLSAEPPRN